MVGKKLKVYTCSNVAMDYFIFLSETIKNAGYEVEPLYLVSEGSYRRNGKNLGLKKAYLRFQMYVGYPLYLVYKVLTARRNSCFVVTSNTFYAPYLVKRLAGLKKAKVIHLLYDLYPDAIEVAGMIRNDSSTSKTIGSIMQKIQAKCDATVYLGEYLKQHAEGRWGRAAVSKVIDISTDLALFKQPFKQVLQSKKLILHYGGQLGHLHDAESLIESVKYVLGSDLADKVEFNFYVSGAQAQHLAESLSAYPVKIISAVPSMQWRLDIAEFHVGMVSLSTGGASVCLPSKTYGMMAGGMAILAICPRWSDLATLVQSNNAGWVVNNSTFDTAAALQVGDYHNNLNSRRTTSDIVLDFYTTLKDVLSDEQRLASMRANAFSGMRAHYDLMALSNKWEDLIETL
ncbi:hypothetical protein GCM10011387_18440 [Pedobacter quisquiliarum]|uniref:Uncharacterized protein n=1 Tax=Pedobacter quisquiliarum TaxID=1834438 RepID=A0A916U9T4_9SPHI|nr:hypothetical protein [Pedobacter quisquiliarum]GGC65129.1 hypothetical protein GCM10011387_18440 [Pedobacter quisquiliarum]